MEMSGMERVDGRMKGKGNGGGMEKISKRERREVQFPFSSSAGSSSQKAEPPAHRASPHWAHWANTANNTASLLPVPKQIMASSTTYCKLM